MRARGTWAMIGAAAALAGAVAVAQAPPASSAPAAPAIPHPPAGASPETAVASVVPSSVPIGIKSVEYSLPFSLSDCYTMLSTARKALHEHASGEQQYDLESIVGLLETVTNYLRDRDSMHANLIDYEWSILASRAVDSALPRTETLRLDPRNDGEDIVALSFEVDAADATIHVLEVYNDENELVGPFRREVTLRHSLPRRYVFHLYRPTDVQRILLTTSQARPGSGATPRIVIHAGRTDQPEHAKGAIHFIWRSQLAMRAGEFDKAQQRLQWAQDEIVEYRRMLRSE